MTAPKKIMIADDDPGIVDAVEMVLEFEGFPDLFLLDIWMSGQDGRDICRELHYSGRFL